MLINDPVACFSQLIDRLPFTVDTLKASRIGKIVVYLEKNTPVPGEFIFLLYHYVLLWEQERKWLVPSCDCIEHLPCPSLLSCQLPYHPLRSAGSFMLFTKQKRYSQNWTMTIVFEFLPFPFVRGRKIIRIKSNLDFCFRATQRSRIWRRTSNGDGEHS